MSFRRSFMNSYRKEMGQTTISCNERLREGDKRANNGKNHQEKFHEKLRQKKFDEFNGVDLVYYLKWVATKAGVRYSISNMQIEATTLKRLRNDFTAEEICNMIDFVYESNQNYLDKRKFAPGILSSWRNTIFPDSQDWLGGHYKPRNNKIDERQEKIKRREWGTNKNTNSAKVGEWD